MWLLNSGKRVGCCCLIEGVEEVDHARIQTRVGESLAGVPVSKQTLGSQLITGTMGGLILSGWAGTPADSRHRAPELLATAGVAELLRNGGGLINTSPSDNAFTCTYEYSSTTTYEYLDPHKPTERTILFFQQHTTHPRPSTSRAPQAAHPRWAQICRVSQETEYSLGALHSIACPADNQPSRRRRGVTAQPSRAPGPAGTI